MNLQREIQEILIIFLDLKNPQHAIEASWRSQKQTRLLYTRNVLNLLVGHLHNGCSFSRYVVFCVLILDLNISVSGFQEDLGQISCMIHRIRLAAAVRLALPNNNQQYAACDLCTAEGSAGVFCHQ
jgi:hypothetical protein